MQAFRPLLWILEKYLSLHLHENKMQNNEC